MEEPLAAELPPAAVSSPTHPLDRGGERSSVEDTCLPVSEHDRAVSGVVATPSTAAPGATMSLEATGRPVRGEGDDSHGGDVEARDSHPTSPRKPQAAGPQADGHIALPAAAVQASLLGRLAAKAPYDLLLLKKRAQAMLLGSGERPVASGIAAIASEASYGLILAVRHVASRPLPVQPQQRAAAGAAAAATDARLWQFAGRGNRPGCQGGLRPSCPPAGATICVTRASFSHFPLAPALVKKWSLSRGYISESEMSLIEIVVP